ncbi:hypothetical protein EVAR_94642_1 [Eumeta japonica]|uniref:Uncharacterized protein n=1 Tax=Eumeta variegata TaxID=151549 RepID=A0A4C1UUY8_EUMVA|nr:hypothetical protein EVAR_94642_1 [Eumeta japonica]
MNESGLTKQIYRANVRDERSAKVALGSTQTILVAYQKGPNFKHPEPTSLYEVIDGRQQLQKLSSEVQLGDQRPPQLLRRVRDLARTQKIPDDTLRVMWTGHLPTAVRAVLAASDTKDRDNLAAVADKIIENTRPLVDVNKVTSSMNHAPSGSH